MYKAACALVLGVGPVAASLFLSTPVFAQRLGRLEVPVQKSGKVVMADGSPLPEPVDIEKLCGGAGTIAIARTDSNGGFVVGSGRTGQSDARVGRDGSRPGAPLAGLAPPSPAVSREDQNPLDRNQKLAGCALQARLVGYESSRLIVVDEGSFDLGTITLTRRAGVEGSVVSATGLYAPKDARKNYEAAKQAISRKKPDQARTLLEKAVREHPAYAAAWFELGGVRQAARDAPGARQAFEQAIQADPKYISPYLGLAYLHNAAKDWKGCADATAAVIRLDPFDYPVAYALNALSNLRLNNDAAAEASARKAVEMGAAPAFPEVEYTLGVIAGSRGDVKTAAAHLTRFLQLAPDHAAAEAVKKQLENWGHPAAPK
jgi:tetratricopeptide (TPR) repeat protein